MPMTRRLFRSRTDTILGGVAAGLADYLNADPALVRIAWAILVPLTGGVALLAYIVAWIAVPEAPAADVSAAAEPAIDPVTGETIAPAVGSPTPARTATVRDDGRAGVVVGAGLVLIGLWFLLREYLPDFDWNLVWPLIIVGIGAVIVVASMRRR
jgi:phage shock protein C